jgi:DNA-binding MarR family transcriptional regulator
VTSSAGQSLARWEVLYILGEAPGTVPQLDRLGRTRQGVQRVVDLLLDEALVVSRSNPRNRKSPTFVLTAAGESTLYSINTAAREWHHMLIEEIGAQRLQGLRNDLQRLTMVARRWMASGRLSG